MLEHPSKKLRQLQTSLQAFESNVMQFLKTGKKAQQNKDHALLKQFAKKLRLAQRLRLVIQQSIQTLEAKIPPPSILDALYEEVIEWNKKAMTKATIENRQAYQGALSDFLEAYGQ